MSENHFKTNLSPNSPISEDSVETEITPEYLIQLKLETQIDNKSKLPKQKPKQKPKLRNKEIKQSRSQKKTKQTYASVFCQLCGDHAGNGMSIMCSECNEPFHEHCVSVTNDMLGENGLFSCQTCVLQYPRRQRSVGTYLMDGKQITNKNSKQPKSLPGRKKSANSTIGKLNKPDKSRKSIVSEWVSEVNFEYEQNYDMSAQYSSKNNNSTSNFSSGFGINNQFPNNSANQNAESDVDVEECPVCDMECTCGFAASNTTPAAISDNYLTETVTTKPNDINNFESSKSNSPNNFDQIPSIELQTEYLHKRTSPNTKVEMLASDMKNLEVDEYKPNHFTNNIDMYITSDNTLGNQAHNILEKDSLMEETVNSSLVNNSLKPLNSFSKALSSGIVETKSVLNIPETVDSEIMKNTFDSTKTLENQNQYTEPSLEKNSDYSQTFLPQINDNGIVTEKTLVSSETHNNSNSNVFLIDDNTKNQTPIKKEQHNGQINNENISSLGINSHKETDKPHQIMSGSIGYKATYSENKVNKLISEDTNNIERNNLISDGVKNEHEKFFPVSLPFEETYENTTNTNIKPEAFSNINTGGHKPNSDIDTNNSKNFKHDEFNAIIDDEFEEINISEDLGGNDSLYEDFDFSLKGNNKSLKRKNNFSTNDNSIPVPRKRGRPPKNPKLSPTNITGVSNKLLENTSNNGKKLSKNKSKIQAPKQKNLKQIQSINKFRSAFDHGIKNNKKDIFIKNSGNLFSNISNKGLESDLDDEIINITDISTDSEVCDTKAVQNIISLDSQATSKNDPILNYSESSVLSSLESEDFSDDSDILNQEEHFLVRSDIYGFSSSDMIGMSEASISDFSVSGSRYDRNKKYTKKAQKKKQKSGNKNIFKLKNDSKSKAEPNVKPDKRKNLASKNIKSGIRNNVNAHTSKRNNNVNEKNLKGYLSDKSQGLNGWGFDNTNDMKDDANDEVFYMAVRHQDFGYEISGYSDSEDYENSIVYNSDSISVEGIEFDHNGDKAILYGNPDAFTSEDQSQITSGSDIDSEENIDVGEMDDFGDIEGIIGPESGFSSAGLGFSNHGGYFDSEDSEDEELTFRKVENPNQFGEQNITGTDSDREEALLQMHLEQLRAVREICPAHSGNSMSIQNSNVSDFDDIDSDDEICSDFSYSDMNKSNFSDSFDNLENEHKTHKDRSFNEKIHKDSFLRKKHIEPKPLLFTRSDPIIENSSKDLYNDSVEFYSSYCEPSSDERPLVKNSDTSSDEDDFYDQNEDAHLITNSKHIYKDNFTDQSDYGFIKNDSRIEVEGSFEFTKRRNSDWDPIEKSGFNVAANVALWDDINMDDASLALGLAMSLEQNNSQNNTNNRDMNNQEVSGKQPQPLVIPATNEVGEQDDPIDGMVSVNLIPKKNSSVVDGWLVSSYNNKKIGEVRSFPASVLNERTTEGSALNNGDFDNRNENSLNSVCDSTSDNQIKSSILPQWVSDLVAGEGQISNGFNDYDFGQTSNKSDMTKTPVLVCQPNDKDIDMKSPPIGSNISDLKTAQIPYTNIYEDMEVQANTELRKFSDSTMDIDIGTSTNTDMNDTYKRPEISTTPKSDAFCNAEIGVKSNLESLIPNYNILPEHSLVENMNKCHEKTTPNCTNNNLSNVNIADDLKSSGNFFSLGKRNEPASHNSQAIESVIEPNNTSRREVSDAFKNSSILLPAVQISWIDQISELVDTDALILSTPKLNPKAENNFSISDEKEISFKLQSEKQYDNQQNLLKSELENKKGNDGSYCAEASNFSKSESVPNNKLSSSFSNPADERILNGNNVFESKRQSNLSSHNKLHEQSKKFIIDLDENNKNRDDRGNNSNKFDSEISRFDRIPVNVFRQSRYLASSHKKTPQAFSMSFKTKNLFNTSAGGDITKSFSNPLMLGDGLYRISSLKNSSTLQNVKENLSVNSLSHSVENNTTQKSGQRNKSLNQKISISGKSGGKSSSKKPTKIFKDDYSNVQIHGNFGALLSPVELSKLKKRFLNNSHHKSGKIYENTHSFKHSGTKLENKFGRSLIGKTSSGKVLKDLKPFFKKEHSFPPESSTVLGHIQNSLIDSSTLVYGKKMNYHPKDELHKLKSSKSSKKVVFEGDMSEDQVYYDKMDVENGLSSDNKPNHYDIDGFDDSDTDDISRFSEDSSSYSNNITGNRVYANRFKNNAQSSRYNRNQFLNFETSKRSSGFNIETVPNSNGVDFGFKVNNVLGFNLEETDFDYFAGHENKSIGSIFTPPNSPSNGNTIL
ncbi:hypothetical protein BB558_005365 [Smittium angustum]|uniref:PHD-type domain-containing protein n=1 Tax=Smittium angustum TaxID=133377 RepID=A0A2U1J0P7_SMIAN|nr:hypothetical protein BB558_005365 [Smittium angustum]